MARRRRAAAAPATLEALPDSVLVSVLLLLPLDARLRCCVLNRRFGALLATPEPLAVLDFSSAEFTTRGRPSDADLARLCRLAGGVLRSLDVSGGGRGRISCAGLAAALAASPGLRALRTLRGEADGAAGGDELCLHLSPEHAASVAASCLLLDAAACDVGVSAPLDALAAALRALPGATTAVRLYLTTPAGGAAAAARLQAGPALTAAFRTSAPNLRSLSANGVALRDGGVASLAAALSAAPALTVLELNKNSVSDAGCDALATLVAPPAGRPAPPLRALLLRHNRIGDGGAAALAAALCSLTHLDLQANAIGAVGAQALAAAMQLPGCALTHLDLRKNGVGDDGATALAAALGRCTAMRYLCLGHNGVGEAGAEALRAALEASTQLRLRRLGLAGNEEDVSRDTLRALDAARIAACRRAEPPDEAAPAFNSP